MNVVPSQFENLSRSLQAATMRHRVLSHNLANINTPGYRRMDVRFDNLVSTAESSQAETDLSSARITLDPEAVPRADGNSVDVDLELNEVQRNSLAAQTYIKILASKLAMMRTAITGQ